MRRRAVQSPRVTNAITRRHDGSPLVQAERASNVARAPLLKSSATDSKRNNVTAYAVFKATHTGEGGPPPTGKSTSSDYVYNMRFDGEKISHMTKIWNSG